MIIKSNLPQHEIQTFDLFIDHPHGEFNLELFSPFKHKF